MFKKKDSILVFDTETDSKDASIAKLKWFGAYNYLTDEYILLPFIGNEKEIKKIIKDARVLIGFNSKAYDAEVLKNNLDDDNLFDYKVMLDLYEMSAKPNIKAPFNKNRLAQMGIKLKSFSLKNIIEKLKLDDTGTKGDIDYKIFEKDTWNLEEIEEIKKYLKQDVVITKKLFEWYESQFSPLKKFLPEKERRNFLYLKSSLSVLGYHIICNKAGLKVEWGEKTPGSHKAFSGGHHIEQREELTKGNIIEIDFASAYPHALMMGNLYSKVTEEEEGWTGDNYYNIQGKYNTKELGKIEKAIQEIFLERLQAKKSGDKPKNISFKLVINSIYGISGNPVFKSIYSRKTPADCTSIVRTWMKKLAKHLEEHGFHCLYGFTDSIYVLLPSGLKKEHLMQQVNKNIKQSLSHMPFPMKTFIMDVEEEIKMIWFIAKNCYLFVTKDDKIKYKSTLLNANTPKSIMKLFETYMTPKILKELDVNFTYKELEVEMKKILEKEPEIAATEWNVNDKDSYKVDTSMQYQISERYGEGRHLLIPNKRSIGVGKEKNSKKKLGIRHCSIKEFHEKKLTATDIDMTQLLSHLKVFYLRHEKAEQEKIKQETLY